MFSLSSSIRTVLRPPPFLGAPLPFTAYPPFVSAARGCRKCYPPLARIVLLSEWFSIKKGKCL
ncbi:glycoside hydrolase family 15 protein [Sesbania bispinosa]|nr:glycoside hydrolase family 15 protein [Sesbania bispinosa]